MHIADRIAHIQPFHVMKLLGRARELEAQGKSVIHMEIGEPDFITPEPILDAAKKALAEGKTHYTSALGLMPLREAIAQFYYQRYNVNVSPQRIVVTPGASGGLLLTLGLLINPGNQVLMTDPGYPCNRHFVRFVEGQPVCMPVTAESRYQPSLEQLTHYWNSKTVAIMLASPANPTGTLLPFERFEKIAAFVAEKKGYVISDEIYHGLVYAGSVQTAVSLGEQVFVINSFSKYFNMTGWRLGWLIVPEQYTSSVEKLAQNLFLAAPTLAQYAALAAFEPETISILEARREEFRQRRDTLLPQLQSIGFKFVVKPEGAFYLYSDCADLTNNSLEFANQLLEQAGVAVTPGIDFGTNAANSHIRFAYTTSIDRLEEGVARIKTFIENRN